MNASRDSDTRIVGASVVLAEADSVHSTEPSSCATGGDAGGRGAGLLYGLGALPRGPHPHVLTLPYVRLEPDAIF